MHQHDVLIVGAGPSGSTLAWALRQQGLNVAIIDKQQFPRDKVCAGWITPAVIQSLQLDITEYTQKNILQPIHGFRVGRISGGMHDINYHDGPVSYSIRRCEFDTYLLHRCGAIFYAETKFETAYYENGIWIVNENFSAPLLVGAGGHFCPVARHIGAKVGKAEMIVAAHEMEFAMTEKQQQSCKVMSDKPELYFCDDLKGYGWAVRKKEYLNIGLGREDNVHLSEHVSDFCKELKQQGRVPEDIPNKFHGHAYLRYPQAKRQVVSDGVMLIGDAAGLAYAESGEGIRPAIESALLAAEVVRENCGAYSKERLLSYVRLLEKRFGKRATTPNPIESSTLEAIKVSLGNALLAARWFDKYIVLNHWFLHQQQTPLVLKNNIN